MADRAAADHAVDAVPIGQGPCQGLEQERADAFARAGAPAGRVQQQPDPADERGGTFAAVQGGDGEVEGDEHGGLGGVDRLAGAGQAEQGGKPVGQAPLAARGHRAGPLGRPCPGREQHVVTAAGAGEHPDAARRPVARGQGVQAAAGAAGVLERLPGGLQEQPLLGVDQGGLVRVDPEELRVEVLYALQVVAPLVAGPAGRRRGGAVVPAARAAPEGGEVGGARVAAGHPDHRDRLGARPGGLCGRAIRAAAGSRVCCGRGRLLGVLLRPGVRQREDHGSRTGGTAGGAGQQSGHLGPVQMAVLEPGQDFLLVHLDALLLKM